MEAIVFIRVGLKPLEAEKGCRRSISGVHKALGSGKRLLTVDKKGS